MEILELKNISQVKKKSTLISRKKNEHGHERDINKLGYRLIAILEER